MQKSVYKTKQMNRIHDYLREHAGEHVTVNDISNALKEDGKAVGTATIYRHLEQLVQQGAVMMYSVEGAGACYEYVGEHHDECSCYHFKCEKCGKLYHIHCDEVAHLQEHLMQDHGLLLDPRRTVFYGVCSTCQEVKQ